MENTLREAEDLLHRVEKETKTIGLFLNAGKTKFMHLNPTSEVALHTLNGSEIKKFDDFLYLGGYTKTVRNIETRTGKAWGALHSLSKMWVSPIKKKTKMRVFKASVESILLFGSDYWTLTMTQSNKLMGHIPECGGWYKTSLGNHSSPTSCCMSHIHAYQVSSGNVD